MGVLNTSVHWLIFLALINISSVGQAIANLLAFICAVTISFFANAKITFRRQTSLRRYLTYVLFLGALAWAIGKGAERTGLPAIITLIGFSVISLVTGFLYSRFIVFNKENIR